MILANGQFIPDTKDVGVFLTDTNKGSGGKYSIQRVINEFEGWTNAVNESIGNKLEQKSLKKSITRNCLCCEKPTTNPMFCSQSCSAKINNIKSPKRKSIKKYCKCGAAITKVSERCWKCYQIASIKSTGEKTLSEYRKIPASKSRYQGVRNHAHQIVAFFGLKPNHCHLCDYSNHLDLCHIKDICSFPDNAKLSEINDMKNLVFLCPNHHWDLGHGKIRWSG